MTALHTLEKINNFPKKHIVCSSISQFFCACRLSFGTGCHHGMLPIERFLWFQLCSLEPGGTLEVA